MAAGFTSLLFTIIHNVYPADLKSSQLIDIHIEQEVLKIPLEAAFCTVSTVVSGSSNKISALIPAFQQSFKILSRSSRATDPFPNDTIKASAFFNLGIL
jgi:hypothetical protein